MGECKLDHSLEDVKKKFESQAEFLPESIKTLFDDFFAKQHTQEILNEVFHLLKKYDLVSEDEKKSRDNQLLLILKNV